ncbi:hypothetical protein [Sorangium sp. So ce1099]|uniref:hypothetical protein n=1 Tax=Sorangium sp. So ce1099 TaxID=3133331 RepID=UPI003F5F8B3F
MNRQETRDVTDARCAKSTKKSSFLGALGVLGALALLFEPARPDSCGRPPLGSGEHTRMR